MAISNRDRVGRAFELLAAGLGPFVDRRMRTRATGGDRWFEQWQARERGPVSPQDPAVQLKVMADCWDTAFRDELTRSDRNIVFELRDVRNKWAHNESFTADDAYRALDSIERLLTAVDAVEASDVGRSKGELMRLRYEAEARKATPRQEVLVNAPTAGLKPWRDVIAPHDDVARGRFALAEFAADLHQVKLGRGAAEYIDPVEFFTRSYLTAGLRTLLTGAVRRLASADGGVPVVDLQTTFGGGKTHSEIALWHLFSGTSIDALPQEVQDLVRDAGIGDQLPAVRRVALVGTKLSPGQPSIKDDGTEVRTLWGELAWGLGGRAGYDIVAESDRTATNPGENLDRLLATFSPCLILIDEWVAYARQLFGAEGLPGGSFDTHFSFAQALTEAVRATPDTLLVLSLPVSEPVDGRAAGIGSETELGGTGGREALRRLRSVIGRMESSWRPATGEESFEIVRRRLFKPIEPAQLAHRDATARAFGEMYRREAAEFPSECREPAYVQKIQAAYPIHPELFTRLYEDWSTLDRFQRTRGVLRLMAAVIHALWEAGDQSPLILPAAVPLVEPAVAAELTRNLDDLWKPIIDADIDGPSALPAQLDRDVPNLGRYQASRRVARTLFLGSAPTFRSPNRGLEATRVRLGCALPGESIATFGDALSRLSGRATFLYTDGGRYWYGVQPSVARVARDRAERYLTQARDEIHDEIIRRLRTVQSQPGEFRGVHPAPATTADVDDESRTRLVILGPEHAHQARSDESGALTAAREVLDRCGTTPRQYRNCLVFLAADSRRLEELESAAADHLAWSSIHNEAGADGLNLDPAQASQAAVKHTDSDTAVDVRLAETYQWLLVPAQPEPTRDMQWDTVRVEGRDGLAVRAARKLIGEGYLYASYPATLLRKRLDEQLAAMWEPGHVAVSALWDVLTRYLYLPRLRDLDVLLGCVAAGPASLSWQQDGFATADGIDDEHRYLGLTVGGHPNVTPTSLVVRPDVAARQSEADARAREKPGAPKEPEPAARGGEAPTYDGEIAAARALPVRFHGAVRLDPERLNRDFGRVAQEVVAHLSGLLDTDVEITVDISARSLSGFSDATVRNVTENARTLRFTDYGFEDK
jgi:predicted AAA+ superfamily ATPase